MSNRAVPRKRFTAMKRASHLQVNIRIHGAYRTENHRTTFRQRPLPGSSFRRSAKKWKGGQRIKRLFSAESTCVCQRGTRVTFTKGQAQRTCIDCCASSYKTNALRARKRDERMILACQCFWHTPAQRKWDFSDRRADVRGNATQKPSPLNSRDCQMRLTETHPLTFASINFLLRFEIRDKYFQRCGED